MDADVVIAGAGLAGACAALALSRTRRVIVLEAGRIGASASGAAAGLVNPFMGRKARPVWRHAEALDALHAMLAEAEAAHLFRASGVLRPAADARQAEAFRDATPLGPSWWSAEAAAERWPEVQAPHGGLWIAEGGSVDIAAWVRAALAVVEQRGGTVRDGVALRGWRQAGRSTIAITDDSEIGASCLLLAVGDGARRVPALARLPLHRVKGQTIRLGPPDASGALPAVSGGAYVVPRPDGVLVGATFEHTFETLAPTPEASARLRERAARLVPRLADAPLVEARAGVRLTVPTVASPRRLPLLGPVPGEAGVWVFSGLGAKGLLTAPLLAQSLPDALGDVAALPSEVRAPLGG